MTFIDNFKEFFTVSDYLFSDEDETSFNYRKTVIVEDNLFKENFGENVVSFERYDSEKFLCMASYLEYKTKTIYEDLPESEAQKWVNDLAGIRNFFAKTKAHIDYNKTFITTQHIFIQHSYEKIMYSKFMDEDDDDKSVGRLYSDQSIQSLPREIRHFLFKDDYLDFDIENAHPVLLHNYSKKQKLTLNGFLKEYVEKRKLVMEKIQDELSTIPKGMLEVSSVKQAILLTLNESSKVDLPLKHSHTLSKLNEDFHTIKDHLWDSYLKGNLPEYSSALEKSLKKKEFKYIRNGIVNNSKKISIAKVVLSCFYCQTQESIHLIGLVEFLRSRYLPYLEEEGKLLFSDYYDATDRRVDLHSKHTLFLVPFFDGLYISSPCKKFMDDLLEMIDEYNSTSEVRFLQKAIEDNLSRIKDREEYWKYSIIFRWLSRASSKYYLKLFLQNTGLENSISSLFEKNPNLNKEDFDNLSDYTDELISHSGQIAEVIKLDTLKKLLELPINCENDISELIKSYTPPVIVEKTQQTIGEKNIQ